ncbi:hypothetical protein [Streptomyces europaeiscabiei]|uniref:hypothetical protein n=1 Tax=Streptomyces europaeiscabiei TaxID=146819 RepID=UPI002E159490|nr:hypothetical protein OHB30_11960 [Streptomyces europaeiscabiei]
MYALILSTSTPFVLLAAVMALSWWEDRILPTPPAEPAEAPTEERDAGPTLSAGPSSGRRPGSASRPSVADTPKAVLP